jgi:hypothetical protein
MYNLLRKKRNHFGALDEIQSLGKQRNVFTKKVCFVLTNAPASIVWVLLLNWLKKLAPQSFPATSVTDLERI